MVATSGNQSFISGVGNLKFQLQGGLLVIIKGLLFCEQARSTLLSLAALRKANATIAYDNGRDTFHIFGKDGREAFVCSLEDDKN